MTAFTQSLLITGDYHTIEYVEDNLMLSCEEDTNMEITSINTAYAMGTNDYAVKKNNDVERKSQTNNVEEYYEKLCKKFPQISFNTQGGVMPCSPGKTVVNLSPDCLKKMANDPEFAKEVEWNLSGEEKANALIYSWAKRDGIEIYGKTVSYDANGNRESSYGMRTANVGNGNSTSKIQKKYKEEEELWIKARKKREEKEEAEARIEEKRREKQEFQERMEKMRSEREAYLEHFNNANGSLGSYQSIELSQAVSFFDKNA